ncbi:MAG: PQQ-dependent sugar dehydrogenase [Hyphomicrobiaceae bacterium]|nr:PQQ-dependent sugar dehydrogenase [Hyphomicrobiaceae bacterium]
MSLTVLPRGAAALVLLASLALLASSVPALDRTVKTTAGPLRIETLASGLNHPWGLAYLPDGRMLVTERPGRLRLVARDGTVSQPLRGVPKVFAVGSQAGLLDVAIDPKFKDNRLVYLSYAEQGPGGASTAVARAELADGGLQDAQVIFRQTPRVDGPNHWGSRLVFARDGTLFVTLGERFKFAVAQDLSNTLGKIVRINPDGSIPKDNPFIGKEGARPEIWSYGHRNVEGAAIHPETGVLWADEMGPLGGDELNIPEAGKNYGWPVVSWGSHYDGRTIPKPPTRPDLAGSIYHWNPVISPSGMAFYTADAIPAWKGSLLIGGLSAHALVRLSLVGQKVTDEERIPMGARIRDVRQAPDGSIHLLTDEYNGKILHVLPEQRGT